MPRPRLAPALLLLGGGGIVLGSFLAWASVRIDLSSVFALFPNDYRQVVSGPELGGAYTAVLGALVILAGLVAVAVPRVRAALGWVGLISALGALMMGLYHLIRIRVIALDRLAEAAGRDVSVLRGASASPGIGLMLIVAGAVLAMSGGVLLLAGRGMAPRGAHAPGVHTMPGEHDPGPAGSPGPATGPAL
jgi:hypothetical protein